ncbi:MFS transporter [Ectobacillus sp. JY-23]|uniref:MFS transporter n=1 Tax=Ectobacillus sp. JY-23 TaxID=2933872 RepID=UPI001FF10686|nr:MFS transporter [Ectobacillus sp. JY-23]UOY92983.1 MFS transporter [Ectobacillus sp. JY-23]
MRRLFRLLLINQILANAGDALYIVALIAMVYKHTQQASAAAAVPVVITLSLFISGFCLPYALHRVKHGQILLVTQLLKTLVLSFICYQGYPLYVLFALVAIIAFLDGFARPVQTSFIPKLSTDVLKANSIVQISNQVIQLMSWPLGSTLVVLYSPKHVLLLALLLYAFSLVAGGVFQSLLHEEKPEALTTSTWKEMLVGWQVVLSQRFVRIITILLALESMSSAVWISAILLVYVHALGVSEIWWGYINSTFFIGLLVGGIAILRLHSYVNPRALLMFTAAITSATTIGFSINRSIMIALLLTFLFGIADQMKQIHLHTMLQQKISQTKLPFVYATHQSVTSLSFSMGTLLFGSIADEMNVFAAFVVAGGIYMLGVLMIKKM